MTRLQELLTPRRTIVVLGVVAVAALIALSISALSFSRARSVDERQRIAVAAQAARDKATVEAQNERLRGAICGTFTAISRERVTEQTTQLGRTLIRETRNGAQVAECPGAEHQP